MAAPKLGIVESKDFSQKAFKTLSAHYAIEVYESKEPLSGFLNDKEAIFVRLEHMIDDNLIKQASQLKFICSPTTGLNHIRITDKSIKIVSLKGEKEFLDSIRATPEHVFGLSIALLRNYKFSFRSKNSNEWNREAYKGHELYGSKIGIIGLGRVGKILARYYSAFDAQVNYYDPNVDLGIGNTCYKTHSLNDLIKGSDIIILCANYEPENDFMLGEIQFKLLEGKYFINAARGELLDEAAFIVFLKKGLYHGVALDVVSCEATDMPSYEKILEIAENKNIVITPHIGGATYSSMHRTEEFIAEKLINLHTEISCM